MKVFLLKDIEKVGMANEILKVADGYAANYLIPRKLAVVVTPENEASFAKKVRQVENRKQVISENTSILAEKIKSLEVTVKRKTNDEGKLFGAITPTEVVEALAEKGVSIGKSQVVFEKSIKTTGAYEVTIKLSSRLQPALTLKVQRSAS